MRILYIFFSLLLPISLLAQMVNTEGDTLYGNEWIDYDQSYLRIKISEDDIYRLTYEDIQSAGFPIDESPSEGLQMWNLGRQQPVYISTEGNLQAGDYIEFYGQKNRGQLDSLLYLNGEHMLNPWYSNFTDTASYYLTYSTDGPFKRLEDREALPNGGGTEAQEWVRCVKRHEFGGSFYKPFTWQGGLSLYKSSYIPKTGFSGAAKNYLSDTFYVVGLASQSGQAAFLNLKVAGNLGDHIMQIKLDGNEVYLDTFVDFEVRELSLELDNEMLEDGELRLEITGLSRPADRFAPVYFEVVYPKTTGAVIAEDQQQFISGLGEARLIEWNAWPGEEAIVYDLGKGQRIVPEKSGQDLRFELDAGEEREILIRSEARGFHDSLLEFVEFENILEDNTFDYIIISHPRLYGEGSDTNWVAEYAAYRGSEAGGNFRTAVVNVLDLYDQFAYGVNRHPQSIRNFAHYLKSYLQDPQYIFMIGKGIEYHTGLRRHPLNYPNFMIPVYGYPGSDNLMLSSNTTTAHVIPGGRIAATSPEQIRLYLEKVKALEGLDEEQTIEGVGWHKNIMHLVGGKPNDAALLGNLMQMMAMELESNCYGADVTTYEKNTSNPVQNNITEAIFDDLNSGVNVVTFFGHSSTSSLDFNINNPNFLKNEPKYPLLIALGCRSGNFSTPGYSVGEEFCFFEKSGFIGSLASADFSYPGDLFNLAMAFYEHMGGDQYGQSIGNILQATLAGMDDVVALERQRQQFLYHGDPAIRLHFPPGPDLTIDLNSLQFAPEVLDARQDSFELSFEVRNLGSCEDKKYILNIERSLPGQDRELVLSDTVWAPLYSQLLTYKLPVGGASAIGENRLYINLDISNAIEELPVPGAEDNNSLRLNDGAEGFPFYVLTSNVSAAYPYEFAIVADEEIVLNATTSNALAGEILYRFELDTVGTFDSPFKKSHMLFSTGGLMEWKPELEWTPDQVYYWRVSIDSSSSPVGFDWSESSFIYLPGEEPGWNQSHHDQWRKNTVGTISVDSSGRLIFPHTEVGLSMEAFIRDFGSPVFIKDGKQIGRFLRGENVRAGVLVSVIDHITTEHWTNPDGGIFGSINNRGTTVGYFSFPTNTLEQRKNLIQFLRDTIKDNDCIYLTAQLGIPGIDSYNPEEWAGDADSLGDDLMSLLEREGATQTRELAVTGSRPYMYIYKKGSGQGHEYFADSVNQVLSAIHACEGFWNNGNMQAQLFGPAKSWKDVSWSLDTGTITAGLDSFSMSLYRHATLEDAGELVRKVDMTADSSFSISDIEDPYISFDYYAYNDAERIPAQPEFWRTAGDPLPDLALSMIATNVTAGQLPEGLDYLLELEVINLSPGDITDSVVLRIELLQADNTILEKIYRIPPLAAGERIQLEYRYPTTDKAGRVRVSAFVNPAQEVAELTFTNNFGITSFDIIPDDETPMLDVTFDGRHLRNGEYIASRPEIRVALRDDNPFIAIDDTDHFELSLEYPDGQQQIIDWDDEQHEFVPSDPLQSNHKAVLSWHPEFDQEGEYFMEVNARDATGNKSSDTEYSINFRIRQAAEITVFQAFPNPFHDQTRFIYTLTGSEPLEELSLEIFDELGRRIAYQRITGLPPASLNTAFVWDGTSDSGGPVPAGTYYYRISAKDRQGNHIPAFNDPEGRPSMMDGGKLFKY